jgi:hypothetical protein
MTFASKESESEKSSQQMHDLASAVVLMRSSLFWDFMQHRLVV